MPRIIAFASMLAALFAAPASAELALERSQTKYATVELGADRMLTAPGDKVRLILRQTLAFGWHSYWLNPGDTGMPTEIKWTAPDGVKISSIAWPTPERQPLKPLMNFGYSGEVLLVSTLIVPADWPAGKPIELTAAASWLVCKDVCIGENQTFTLSLQTGEKAIPDGLMAGLVKYAGQTRPKEAGEIGAYKADKKTLRLSFPLAALGDVKLGDSFFFPEQRGVVAAAAPQKVEVRDGRVHVTMARVSGGSLVPAARLAGRLSGIFKTKDASGAVTAVRLVAVGPAETASAPAK